MAPLVDKERRRLSVGRLDPCWEQTTLVGLEEEELVKVLEEYGQLGVNR